MSVENPRRITLQEEDDGWCAIDAGTGVASQGPTREKASQNLDEAVPLTKEVLEDNTPAPEPNAPWFSE